MPAVLVLVIAALGLRMLPGQQPKSTASQVRIVTVAPVPISVPPRTLETRPIVATGQPSAQATEAPESTPPAAPVDVRASEGPVAAEAPAAAGTNMPNDQATLRAPVAVATPRALAPAIEQRLEARMHTFDPDNNGLSREQLARAFPRAAERFDDVDANHDGRVTAQELIAAWARITIPAQP
jgi:hypothetical protein